MFYGQCWKCGERWALGTASTCKCPEETTIEWTDSSIEVLRLSKDGVWANPDIPVDKAAKLVLEAIDHNIKVLVEKAVADEREECGRVRAAKPRELKPVGRGTLLDEQQFCFDKGWREGAASVRAAIRARSNK
jgi:hypothetical protein